MNTTPRSYQPIDSYGVIGDCHSVVLVAPDGSVDWGCLPDFDSPAIFCRLLDAQHGGYFQIAPDDSTIIGTQRYLRDSNVLQTRFSSKVGELLLTDFMPVETLSAWQFRELNNNTWTREDGSCHSLVRIVECTYGELPITMRLKVSPEYAAAPSVITLLPNNMGAVISGGQQHVGLGIIGAYRLPSLSIAECQQEGESPTRIWRSTPPYRRENDWCLLSVLDAPPRLLVDWLILSCTYAISTGSLAHTLHWWRTWLAGCTYKGDYEAWVKRSALVLKMMTYAPTGAIVAAPTTSLPEEPGGVRNWDYRFTWLRDATFTLYALNVLGFTEEAHAFTHWLRRLSYSNGEDLQIMYGIRGEHDLAERELTHLSGYVNSHPVRIGNGAAYQKQLDVFGEVLDCIHLFRRQGGFERYGEKLEGSLWAMLRLLIEHVCAHWREPDSGIWEVRGEVRHFVYSKVMCWVALDRGIRAAEQLHLEADIERWRQVRDQIRTDILTHGYNTKVGAFTQSYDSTVLDASNLLLPLVGFIAPNDPRMRSTVDCIIQRLTDANGFVYRYHADDGLPGSEGTFTICTFWLVDNLAMQGRVDEARSLFERLLSFAGQLGLFSEEVSNNGIKALGNYPQAFTHIALINSAYNLKKAEMRQAEHHTDPVIAAIQLHQ